MNAMQRMAAGDNAAVARSWVSVGRCDAIDPPEKEPTAPAAPMVGILAKVCSSRNVSFDEVLALRGKINGFNARARQEAIQRMAEHGHSAWAICEYFNMRLKSVQRVVRFGRS